MVLVTIPGALARISISPARAGLLNSSSKAYLRTHSRWTRKSVISMALTPYKSSTSALVRYAATISRPIIPPIDKEREAALGRRILRAHPERVSLESTTHPVFHEIVEPPPRPEPDMMAGINGDLQTVLETFSLKEVPKDALYLGLAGVIPYLATSLSTVYMAWDLNHSAAHGTGVFFDTDSALAALAILEPLQIGYGAVIISFLGAIHWGLEWGSYGGRSDRQRYVVGVVAPAIAWPSILLPVEYALITQFLSFIFLYFQDAKATSRGTAPPWYASFRFVLTFVVGASIVVTLVSRGQIFAFVGHPGRTSDKLQQIRESQLLYLQEEEDEKKRRASEHDEEDGDDEEEAADEDAEEEE